MVTLRCTQKLLTRLGDLKSSTACPASTTALGDWYCNFVRFGRMQVIVCVNERSYLTVLLPAAPSKSFGQRLCERLAKLLQRIGIPQEQIAAELKEMQTLCYDKTASRVKIGVMNQICYELAYFADEFDFDTFITSGEDRTADGIYGAPNYIKPKREAARLLQERWVQG